MPYDPRTIEPKWQAYWADHHIFRAEIDPARPKFYALDMFPYPSGAGLHVGHPLGYTATDIMCRYKRMRGFNVLHPMGWDSFGLPAERHAMRTGVHPDVTTKRNIETFRGQVQRLGFSYDWSREFATTDPAYVRWTQWIFLKLFEKGLAYQAEVAVNWCPAQNAVLADEEVKDGCYIETGDPVICRRMRQWMLRITAYADRLLEGLDGLDWPESLKTMQRNWIGRSEGAEIRFSLEHGAEGITVFTTRPETLFGASYIVLAPEHPAVATTVTPEAREAVAAYIAEAKALEETMRTDAGREKTGVFTGADAVNPATGARLPIWVADYVLAGYGAGALMAVPAHDARDYAFACAHGLPIIRVIDSADDIEKAAFEGEGRMVNSDFLNGLAAPEARKAMIAWLQASGAGWPKVTYCLRDWLFSRQRYWGEPIPVLHLADGSVMPLPEECLPLLPPELDDYAPTPDGEPPLARAHAWVETIVPATDIPARRETNTMPQWAGSCWYFLRFLDPGNAREPVGREAERYWMPVDLYVGGAEHAVLHLLYARFWHKVLYDIGVVSTEEPFQRLFNQGMILAHSYRDAAGRYYAPSSVVEEQGRWFAGPVEVQRAVEKMSKSRLNVVNPDDVVDQFGADALRLYEMFMGPLDAAKPWQTAGVIGVCRFLERAWRIVCDESDGLASAVREAAPSPQLLCLRHQTVKTVTADIEAMRFNTGVSRLMELANALTVEAARPREVVETFVLLLAPFAPHIAEELWSKLGHGETLTWVSWPTFDPAMIEMETREYVVQINGKVRHRFEAAADLGEALLAAARSEPAVMALLDGRMVVKEVLVPGRLVNFVVADL
ncbi:leucine--tRNA ligase [Rhizobium leguminosarum bv. trifolii]|uniref:Leucine--tRNA ligase n=1 Tax=Rhizobium leguminosarum bv. trifolii TaxID=386 RepID=A0A1B8R849_RHILT|nr:leucine--tRNA ligase [Rhizobium leguminosarum]AOO92252.1 leucyl-tRNA synthase [Rhizobium leguminosarum bv. trifolii]MBY5915384.1 leucine--tRNA ligase [Rhizobium leguminosarum]OBY04941.1 leucine--tRNA ligase [Rhizobium leguminosarum bv. trifolii]RWX34129.1 leucine--tRNA ligase [Rhizobium leguminosarum]TBE55127.1 leucine--tRNA ligase [Rhizobium leguminosarum]